VIKLNLLAAALALAVSVGGAQAATVASGGTQVTGAISGDTAYFSDGELFAAADPSEAWVLSDLGGDYNDAAWVSNDVNGRGTTFTFSFDLTGFDVASAVLSIKLAFDDFIEIALNGNTIFEDTDQGQPGGANWSVLQEFTSTSFFQSGLNVLTFSVINTGGPGGLRASTIVTATPSAVPVPAALPLLAGGLLALGALARRRKRA
jgi:hypothetical protein